MSTTVTLGDRRYPACMVVCPCADDQDEDEWDRTLGAGPHDPSIYIPAENGVIFDVAPMESAPGTLSLSMSAATCHRYEPPTDDPWLWLPRSVSLVTGALVAQPDDYRHWIHGVWFWTHAEPEWVAETIDRLSRLPFKEPPGPRVRLVPTDYYDKATGALSGERCR